MGCFVTKHSRVSHEEGLQWIRQNSHRIVSFTAFKYNGGDYSKLMAFMKDGSTFHAFFISYRSLIAWLFHPQFADISLYFVPFEDSNGSELLQDLFKADRDKWITTGGPDHWNLLSKLMGK